ncbi:MAG: GAF domain-containing protein [Chloroflexi bacterium]|nr:GAF domain-containing protein [Chloroflexota bacterium]
MESTSGHKTESVTLLVQAELVNSVAWLINIRWLAGVGVLGVAWFIDVVLLRLAISVLPLYLIGITILAYNAVFRFVLQRLLRNESRDIRQFDQLAKTQIAFDWVAMTALIHFSGGITSPITFYFFFHIVIAAMLFTQRATFAYAATATLLFGATAWLEYTGVLPHVSILPGQDAALFRDPLYSLGVVVFFASTMFVAAYLASTISARLRKRETQVIDLSQNLQRAYGRLQTLYEAAEAVNSTLELDQVLDRLVQRTAHALNVRACSIRLLDETGARLYVAASYGLSETYATKGDLLLEQNPLAKQVLAGKAIITGDVRTETGLQYPTQAITEGILSMLSAPLAGKRGALGLIRAYGDGLNHFTPADAEFLMAIAREGSIAIENAMAYRTLNQIDEMKSKFVLTVTHELRSPVGVIQSLLRTMQAGYIGTLTPAQQETMARILHRADFLQTLIDDLLDLAAGKSQLVQREGHVIVRLDEAVARVANRFEIPMQEKHITLKSNCEKNVTIAATEAGVDRILNNLVSNAVKYTPDGGRVSIKLSTNGTGANLEIADTGIGIPEESLPQLFQEFYRAPNAKAQVSQGTGLGLAITKDLVTHFGGHIAVQSKIGQGTSFCVTFPIVVDLPI